MEDIENQFVPEIDEDMQLKRHIAHTLDAILERLNSYGTAAPTTGYHLRGEVVWNDEPAGSGTPGWVCVTAGTPGTWKAMANLAA